ncbi:MAG: VOC family protein [Pseudomonadota bacterium]
MSDPHIEHAATIVPVRNVAQTVRFYTDILGFDAAFVAGDGTFAMVRRGNAVVQLVLTDSEEVLKATANNIAIYITVRDVDGFYASLAPRLEELPDGRLRRPFNQPYGMREFHVKDPDGCLLFFGQDTDEEADG